MSGMAMSMSLCHQDSKAGWRLLTSNATIFLQPFWHAVDSQKMVRQVLICRSL